MNRYIILLRFGLIGDQSLQTRFKMSCRARSPNAPVVAIPRLRLFIITGFIVGVSHAVFDVVIDDEIQFLIGKSVVLGKLRIDRGSIPTNTVQNVL